MPSNCVVGVRRPFVIGDYQGGELVEVPGECPFQGADHPCDVTLHAKRDRKSGPPHPLAVCRCHAHDVSFTIYPEGFVPYARRPLKAEAEAASTEAEAASTSFEVVAEEAAAGKAWPRQADGGSRRWWSTQQRLLGRLRSVLTGDGDAATRHTIAIAVGVPLALPEQVHRAKGYRARGQALTEVLAALSLDRLLLAGFLAGCWGPAFRWQQVPPRLVPLVPQHLRHFAKGTTNSGPRPPPGKR